MGKKKKQVIKTKEEGLKSLLKFMNFLGVEDEIITPYPFRVMEYLGGILVFLIIFGVYLHTLTPSIGLHDGGDMVTAAYVLGIPHPTGYPFYCLLGKFWLTILPIGNIAYRMNMLSALCAALACLMVYFITLKVGSSTEHGARSTEQKTPRSRLQAPGSVLPAVVAALMVAFATTFWEQAIIAEKYTLNALFATLLIFILFKWAEAQSTEHGARSKELKTPCSRLHAPGFLYLFAFTLGLSFTHHMQTMFLVPAGIFFITVSCWQNKKPSTLNPQPSTLLKMLGFFILPLLLWLYLPIRASANPIHNWGNPDTLDRFLKHVTAGQYGYYFSSSIKELIIRAFTHIIQFFSHQFTIYLVWIGIVGLVLLFKQRRRVFIFFALLILTDIFHSIRYTIINIEDYYIPSFAVFGIFFGYGLLNIIKYLKKYLPPYILLLLGILPIIPYNLHLFSNNDRQHFFAYDYKTNILKQLKPNAILFSEDDNIGFTLWYLCYCEQERPDVTLLDTVFIQYDWYWEQIKSLHHDYPTVLPQAISGEIITRIKIANIIHNNIESRPIYVFSNTWVPEGYGLVPEGMCWRIVAHPVDNKTLFEELEKNKIGFKIRGLSESIHRDWREEAIINNYANSYATYGGIYGNIGKYTQAIIELQKALKLNPKSANAHYNLGIAYKIIGKHKSAIDEFNRVIELEPNNSQAKQALQEIL